MAEYVSSKIFADGTDYDLAVLCYSQNDGDLKTLAVYYEAMIRALRTKYDNIAIISILESPQRSINQKMQTVIDICDYYEIPTQSGFLQSGSIGPFYWRM